MEIRELLPSEKDYINDIAVYEEKIFGDGGIGRWTIMPFVRYGKVYVLLEGEEIVSVAEIMRAFDAKEAYIYGFFTKEKFLKKGYGSVLLDFVIKEMKNCGIDTVTLTVDPENTKAVALYLKHGFEKAGLLEEEYGKNEDRLYMKIGL
jgi:ribosomal-protein-alanine N-acetyltransferase